MEGLNYEIMKMIDEFQILRARQEKSAEKAGDRDGYGFPFEPSDSFGTTPLGFLETTMRLQTEAAEAFGFLREINRHSPLYYKMSSELEKLLGLLGSACITKVVIEQQEGRPMAFLKDLTIDWIREKAAFNFRKCYTSFMESQSLLHFNKDALSLSIRWAALDKRLLATADKIEKIKAGKIKIDLGQTPEEEKDIPESEPAPERKPAAENDGQNETASAFAAKSHAFPVDKTAINGAELHKSAEGSMAGEDRSGESPKPVPDSVPAEKAPEDAGQASRSVISRGTEDPVIDAVSDPEKPEIIDDDLPDNDDGSNEEGPMSVSEELIRRLFEYHNSGEFFRDAMENYELADLPEPAPP